MANTQKCRTRENSTFQYKTLKNKTLHTSFQEKEKAEMAKKASETNSIIMEPVTVGTLTLRLVGDSDLVLCKKARSFELVELYKQSNPKGTKMPKALTQPYNMWEKLITSVHWMNPIEYHDDDWSLYTQEEWENYMKTNTPYILGKAFKDSIKEAFISCGFKNGTGKNGTDLLRTTRFRQKNPVAFESVSPDQHLAMTSGLSRVNVLTQQNVFTNWECELEITFLPSEFPKETLIDLIRTSGMFIGVGSRRGEDYGRYHIGHIEYAEMEQ